jgi:putative transposase
LFHETRGFYTDIHSICICFQKQELFIAKKIRPDIYAYKGGILKDLKHKPIIINGIANHVHIFYGMNPNVSVSDTVKQIKSSSSNLINGKKMIYDKFSWQDGYGGVSYSQSQIENEYKYIANQEEHHKGKTKTLLHQKRLP